MNPYQGNILKTPWYLSHDKWLSQHCVGYGLGLAYRLHFVLIQYCIVLYFNGTEFFRQTGIEPSIKSFSRKLTENFKDLIIYIQYNIWAQKSVCVCFFSNYY